MRSYQENDTRVDVLKLGDYKLLLSTMLTVPEKEWRSKYGSLFEQGISSTGNSTLVRVPGLSIVVDPDNFALSCTPSSEYYPSPDYRPPPDLLAQLETISVKPEDITHVVITHAHYDHFAGVTRKAKSGKLEPTFPNAKYYLGKADWESSVIREGLQKDNPGAWESLETLHDSGILELVTGPHILSNSVKILPAPGESPGHQLLEVQAGGQFFYCVGDLFHHWVEVENPDWETTWADPKLNAVSRRSLYEIASSRNALVIAGHMTPGRIRKKDDGSFFWKDEE